MGIINFSSSGGRKQIATYNSCVSNILFTNKPDWISNPIENSGGLYILVSANSSPSSRTCSDLEITYTSGEYNCSKTITIFQEGVSLQKTNPNLSWSESDKIITLGDLYELPTFNNPYLVTPITFSSNNSSVAQVGAVVGGNPTITINGPGSAVISADFPGNNDYLALKVSYPLTVKKNSTDIQWNQSTYTGTIGEDVSSLLSLTYPGDMNTSNNRLYFLSSDNSYASFTNIYDLTSLVLKKANSAGIKIYAHFTGDSKYSSTSVFCTLKIKDAELIEPVPFIWLSGGNVTTFEATVGLTKGLPTLAYPLDLDTSRIYYSSEDGTVAGFTSSNTVKSLVLRAAGTTKIYADFRGDDKYLPCKVSYVLVVSSEELRDPSNFHWNGNSISITQGEESSVNLGELSLTKERDMEWSEITYSYDGNSGVARVNSSNGLIELLGGLGTVEISATYTGDKYNSKTVKKIITISPAEHQGNAESFDTIISKFNNSGIYSVKITKGTSSETVYDYLETMYNSAKDEYNGNSPLFNVSNYSEIVNYHGTNSQYELDGTAENAMYYWLIAMCLSELLVSKDGNHPYILSSKENTNRQTLLFKFAYDLGKESGYGRKINLYGNYTLKGDVNICRLVATVIYSKNRRNYKQRVSTSRQIMGGLSITPILNPTSEKKKWEETLDITSFGATNCNMKNGRGMLKTSVGYAVNLDDIFPAAAGPYTTNYNPATGLDTNNCDEGTTVTRANVPWELGLSESIFNLSDHNYQVDKAIYDEVCGKYNLNASDVTILRRTVLAIADECEDFTYLLGNKTYYNYNPSNRYGSFTAGTPSSSNYFEGVFNSSVLGEDLSLLSNNSVFTNLLYYTSRACKQNRKTTLDPLYGRRRPGLGTADDSALSTNYSIYNYLYDGSISSLSGGETRYDGSTAYYIDKNGNAIKDTGEIIATNVYGSGGSAPGGSKLRATTYPSGHSAGIWGVAMMLVELLPSRYTLIYKAAYDFCVSRTIVRAHWNSDTIYGRLAASTIVPLLHAFTDFESVYSNAENIINGTVPNNGKGSATLVPNGGNNNSTDNTIDVKIVNNTSSAVTFDKKFGFAFINNGGAYDPEFNVTPNDYATNQSVAANGGELILILNYTPVSSNYWLTTQLSGSDTYVFRNENNVGLYLGTISKNHGKDSNIKDFPVNTEFGLGRIYTINYGGSDPSSVTLKSSGGGGNSGEGVTTLKIINNSTTSLDLSSRIRFIVSHSGAVRTENILFTFNENGSNTITLQPGSSCSANFSISTTGTYFNDTFYDAENGVTVDNDTYYSNIILYDSTGNGLKYSQAKILPSLSTSSHYVNGTYTISIGGGSTPPNPNNNGTIPSITIRLGSGVNSACLTGYLRIYNEDGDSYEIYCYDGMSPGSGTIRKTLTTQDNTVTYLNRSYSPRGTVNPLTKLSTRAKPFGYDGSTHNGDIIVGKIVSGNGQYIDQISELVIEITNVYTESNPLVSQAGNSYWMHCD